MENFIDFFAQMPTWQRLVWVVVCLVLSWSLEAVTPFRDLLYRKWRHAGVNFVFLGTTMVINLLFGMATIGVFGWIEVKEIGLLYMVEWPIWLELLIAVLIFDLIAQYFIHFLLHKYKWMWKMHLVHHSDTKVDATTGTRLHPGDFLLREIFALVVVVLVGAPIAFYLFYRFATVFFTYVTHANINPPLWLDKTLSLVFITPNIHKFHHHYKRPWTDSNFGNIFSIWDRIFGTLVYDDPKKIKYGVDTLEDESDEDIAFQFKMPFNKSIKTDY